MKLHDERERKSRCVVNPTKKKSGDVSAESCRRARDAWIDSARDVKTATILRDRGVLDNLRGRNGKFSGPCPNCAGRDRFAVDLTKGNGGAFHCRGCDIGGNTAISLVCFLDQCDFLSAVETIAGPPPNTAKETDAERHAREQLAAERRQRLEREQREREQREAAEALRTMRYCDALWREAVRLPPDAIAYFARRGITLDDVPDWAGLRFHGRCPFEGLSLPCVIGRFTHAVTRAVGGIWRRPLTGAKPKAIGPMKDHVLRLWPDEDVTRLTIGEGVETTLSAPQIAHKTPLRPAWACASAGNIENFPVLPGVEFLTVLADADRNCVGQNAARVCAKRWAEAGREVEILIPEHARPGFQRHHRASGIMTKPQGFHSEPYKRQKGNGAAHQTCTLARVHRIFGRWLGREYDFESLDAVLSVAAGERLPGDPAWLMMVTGSGNAKTETVIAVRLLNAHIVSTISSDGALLSASPRHQRSKKATGGLLRAIGPRGILVIKDVTSILSMSREVRASVLAALREIHDGRWVRNVGTDGGLTLTWEGRIVVIGACTTAWDAAHAVIASMGDRFVTIRPDSRKGRIAGGRRAMRNAGGEVAMREELAEAVAGLINGINFEEAHYELHRSRRGGHRQRGQPCHPRPHRRRDRLPR